MPVSLSAGNLELSPRIITLRVAKVLILPPSSSLRYWLIQVNGHGSLYEARPLWPFFWTRTRLINDSGHENDGPILFRDILDTKKRGTFRDLDSRYHPVLLRSSYRTWSFILQVVFTIHPIECGRFADGAVLPVVHIPSSVTSIEAGLSWRSSCWW